MQKLHLQKSQREITPIVLAPSPFFIISICLEERNMFARFDEIP